MSNTLKRHKAVAKARRCFKPDPLLQQRALRAAERRAEAVEKGIRRAQIR